jgi:hypothetical protein
MEQSGKRLIDCHWKSMAVGLWQTVIMFIYIYIYIDICDDLKTGFSSIVDTNMCLLVYYQI